MKIRRPAARRASGDPLPLTPLRVLLIDNSETDARLVTRALVRAGYDVFVKHVATSDGLRQALRRSVWDLAVTGDAATALGGAPALSLVREQTIDLPLFQVSGILGDGVSGGDGTGPSRIAPHLAPAVEREIREAAIRRARRRADERIAHLAYHDPLTDLPNRALLHDRLDHAVAMSRREKRPLTLLVLDLDGFKEINDGQGHHAGDRVLQQVAGRLRAALREVDTVARLGGDEFAVLLPATDLTGAGLAAKKILHDLEQPFIIEGRPLKVSASIGLAGFPSHGASSDELLQRADIAMYLAKAERSGYVLYSPDRDRHGEQRIELTTAMRRGVEAQQFILDYQPILHLQSGLVVGVEALLRWDHPERGRLLPKEFLQTAEHTGLINPLTMFAIERALSEWPGASAQRSLTVTVNLSAKTLHDAAFLGHVRGLLKACRASPASLALEVTENLIMSDPERSARCLAELHELGVRLIVDDFGTGYSSLSALSRLPVDELKIDRSFVIELARGEDESLVRCIINLAHDLRLRVVAEGVETEEVRNRLVGLGCDAVQGYFISPPGSAADIAQWIARQKGLGVV
jgi:diguanylate cyclase (GGDEF)-like protein